MCGYDCQTRRKISIEILKDKFDYHADDLRLDLVKIPGDNLDVNSVIA